MKIKNREEIENVLTALYSFGLNELKVLILKANDNITTAYKYHYYDSDNYKMIFDDLVEDEIISMDYVFDKEIITENGEINFTEEDYKKFIEDGIPGDYSIYILDQLNQENIFDLISNF